MHRLPTKASDKIKKTTAMIWKFCPRQFKEHLFLKRKEIYNNTNRRINFHVNLTKYWSKLLQEANLYVRENTDDGQVKFWFPDANEILSIKFYGKRNIKFDTIQPSLAAMERNLEDNK